ncbi:MAG TPA: lactonase family protein [Terracidiphilus sp.]|jgi:6-phosphogluconolactonase (cycloisomerase 2 family)
MKQETAQVRSRRFFLKTAGSLAIVHAALGNARAEEAEPGKLWAFVGTYTTPVDGSGHGEGIYRFQVDPRTGELTHRALAAKTPNPSWIVIHPSRKYLYTINEVADFGGGNGSVSAFAIHPATADLTLLNTVSSAGAGPAHMSLDRSGRFALVANYAGGTIAVLPILDGGRLGDAVDVHHDIGSVGSTQAADAPAGSFAISGHDAPHAHMIAPDPNNRFVLATDLGQDRIYVYRFDAATGKLTPQQNPVSLPAGDGPRHFVFHPNGRWLYLLCEEASTLVFFRYDAERGTLTRQQSLSALPPGFAGTNFGSEIQISPDGRFLYSANRLHDSIAIRSIGSDGKLAEAGEASTMGDYPRYFAFDRSGNFVYACDQRSDCVTSFRVNRTTGRLAFTGNYAAVGSPAMIAFLT